MHRIPAGAAVVGLARSGAPFTPGKTSLQLHAELASEAGADAGLPPGDVDGMLTAGCNEPTCCEDVAHGAVPCEYIRLRESGNPLHLPRDAGGLRFAGEIMVDRPGGACGRCPMT